MNYVNFECGERSIPLISSTTQNPLEISFQRRKSSFEGEERKKQDEEEEKKNKKK